jgi:BON domain-containing protein
MPRNNDRNPKSYEEIVRKTVVEPDGSERPTLEQEQAAREGFRALDTDERALYDRVVDAIATAGAPEVTAEVSRDLVTLRGWVADTALLRAVDEAIARIPGVETIHDQIVVGRA